MSVSLSLSGQTALITGAATGIGRAIALKLSQAGARVVINHLNQPQEAATLVQAIKGAGGQAVAISADVSDSAAVQRLVAEALHTVGDLHILVNNAGIIQEKPFLDT
ncbi:SDR family NAD(P)-dependent oxidoreductase, partial [Hydrogenophaga sp.]